jgi:hypothetical protein
MKKPVFKNTGFLLLIMVMMLTNFVYDIQKKLAIISMNLNKLVLLPQEIDDPVW